MSCELCLPFIVCAQKKGKKVQFLSYVFLYVTTFRWRSFPEQVSWTCVTSAAATRQQMSHAKTQNLPAFNFPAKWNVYSASSIQKFWRERLNVPVNGRLSGRKKVIKLPSLRMSSFYRMHWRIFLPFPLSRHAGQDRSLCTGQKSHTGLWRTMKDQSTGKALSSMSY